MAYVEQEFTPVSGYFPNELSAEGAVRELRAAGFTRNHISLAGSPDGGWTSEDTSPTGAPSIESLSQGAAYDEGRKAGEVIGGFWQHIKNLFESDPAESRRNESARENHPILEDSGAFDYDPDDFHRSWGGAGLSEERARYFSNLWARTGQGVLVSVMAGERRAEAEVILEIFDADLGDTRTDYAYAEGAQNAVATGDSESVGAPLGTATEADLANFAESKSRAEVKGARRIQLYGRVLRIHLDRLLRAEVQMSLRKPADTESREAAFRNQWSPEDDQEALRKAS
jgi:hypothetical protein